MKWNKWVPGLFLRDTRTLGGVLSTMPRDAASSIPEVVQRYENPTRPEALPGAITLDRHDALHILLGRGLSCQDEGFVVGFTMGAASNISEADIETLASAAVNEYPPPFTWSDGDVVSFRLGFRHSQTIHAIQRDIHNFSFEDEWSTQIGTLRGKLGIELGPLIRTYDEERRLLPNSWVSKRLPSHLKEPIN